MNVLPSEHEAALFCSDDRLRPFKKGDWRSQRAASALVSLLLAEQRRIVPLKHSVKVQRTVHHHAIHFLSFFPYL